VTTCLRFVDRRRRIAFHTVDLAAAEGYRSEGSSKSIGSSRARPAGRSSLQKLSLISWAAEDYALAERSGQGSAGDSRRFDPQLDRAYTLHLWGIAVDRPTYAVLEDYFRQALTIDHCAPGRPARRLRPFGALGSRSPGDGTLRRASVKRFTRPRSRNGSRGQPRAICSLIASAKSRVFKDHLPVAASATKRHSRSASVLFRELGKKRRPTTGLGWSTNGRSYAKAARVLRARIDALEQQRARLGGTNEAHGSFSIAHCATMSTQSRAWFPWGGGRCLPCLERSSSSRVAKCRCRSCSSKTCSDRARSEDEPSRSLGEWKASSARPRETKLSMRRHSSASALVEKLPWASFVPPSAARCCRAHRCALEGRGRLGNTTGRLWTNPSP